jgi:hypothetical protein
LFILSSVDNNGLFKKTLGRDQIYQAVHQLFNSLLAMIFEFGLDRGLHT